MCSQRVRRVPTPSGCRRPSPRRAVEMELWQAEPGDLTRGIWEVAFLVSFSSSPTCWVSCSQPSCAEDRVEGVSPGLCAACSGH